MSAIKKIFSSVATAGIIFVIGSYAKVGNGKGGGWSYAKAGIWSYAQHRGKGTFVAKYSSPFN